MKLGFLEWLGRVAMLVLAGMITLSIIGAIAAIPSGIDTRMGVEQATRQLPPPEASPEPLESEASLDPAEGGPADAAVAAAVAPEADEADDPVRWLEAITYALLALAGIAALATVILWRGLHERRRIADALEILSARP